MHPERTTIGNAICPASLAKAVKKDISFKNLGALGTGGTGLPSPMQRYAACPVHCRGAAPPYPKYPTSSKATPPPGGRQWGLKPFSRSGLGPTPRGTPLGKGESGQVAQRLHRRCLNWGLRSNLHQSLQHSGAETSRCRSHFLATILFV